MVMQQGFFYIREYKNCGFQILKYKFLTQADPLNPS
jgi:hypothetical protein